eukprot:852912-Rhodomonas_salina.2
MTLAAQHTRMLVPALVCRTSCCALVRASVLPYSPASTSFGVLLQLAGCTTSRKKCKNKREKRLLTDPTSPTASARTRSRTRSDP